MRLTRVHAPGPLVPGEPCTLRGEAANHVARVLRLDVGDALTVFDGEGAEYFARVAAVARGEVCIVPGQRRANERESSLRLTLVQGVSRGERMDWVVQKAVELGVTRIVPVLTERSVVRLDAAQAHSKQRHWRGIAVAACEQSGRGQLPQITAAVPFGVWLAGLPPGGLRVLPSPDGAAGLASLPPLASEVLVLIGPEGGLSDREAAAALGSGFHAVRLGPRVLRTETAAVVALALLQQRFGDL